MQKQQLHYFFPNALIVYMLFALLWWAMLLFMNNKELTAEKLKILKLESNITYKSDDYDITTLDEYNEILSKHKRQRWMIIGEGLVFGLSLIIGMGFIHRAYSKEIANNARQKNFLLSITHELKSPIASIGLILETLRKRKLEMDQIDELTGSALKENRRLEKLINNILLATRLEAAYFFNFENMDIIPLVDEIVDKYKVLNGGLDISANHEEDSVFAEIDREGFISMINNLIENAIKYNDDKPIIRIETKLLHHDITIRIKDNGIGIPADEIPKVTDQFYRVGSEDTRKTKGTGLGLFIVKKILSAHKGTLHILPNSPKGTIFEIRIPCKHRS